MVFPLFTSQSSLLALEIFFSMEVFQALQLHLNCKDLCFLRKKTPKCFVSQISKSSITPVCVFLSCTKVSETARNAVDHSGIILWQITLTKKPQTPASAEICFPRIRIGGQTHFFKSYSHFHSQFYKHYVFVKLRVGDCTHNNTPEKELRTFQLASVNPNVFSTKILVSRLFVRRVRCLVPSFDRRSGVYIVPSSCVFKGGYSAINIYCVWSHSHRDPTPH